MLNSDARLATAKAKKEKEHLDNLADIVKLQEFTKEILTHIEPTDNDTIRGVHYLFWIKDDLYKNVFVRSLIRSKTQQQTDIKNFATRCLSAEELKQAIIMYTTQDWQRVTVDIYHGTDKISHPADLRKVDWLAVAKALLSVWNLNPTFPRTAYKTALKQSGRRPGSQLDVPIAVMDTSEAALRETVKNLERNYYIVASPSGVKIEEFILESMEDVDKVYIQEVKTNKNFINLGCRGLAPNYSRPFFMGENRYEPIDDDDDDDDDWDGDDDE